MAKWKRKMPRLTTDQIEFAKTMTIKQRGVLNALCMYDCYMSASEIADDELRELVRNRLARYHVEPGMQGRLSCRHGPFTPRGRSTR